jgi:hypothetical protein
MDRLAYLADMSECEALWPDISRRASPPLAVAAFGVSTPFCYWGFHLVREIVAAIGGPLVSLHVLALRQLREGLHRRDGRSVVITSDLPDSDLAGVLLSYGLPVIFFADDPETMFDWAVESRGLTRADGARFCSRLGSALVPTVSAARKLVLARSWELSPASVVAEVVEFLRPGRSQRLAAQTYEFLVGSGKIAAGSDAGLPPRSDAAKTRADEHTVAAAYCDLLLGRPPEEIDWPLALFTRPDGRPWRDPIELAGPARALLYGPYMHLPSGAWTARVEFETVGALSGVEATTDVRIKQVVNAKAFVLPANGVFAFDLGFDVCDPHQPVEIRLFLRKAAIEGVFLLRSVKVRPRRGAF